MFLGASPMPATFGECICTGVDFDLDPYDRLYVPDAYRMCVHVLDTNGNYLLRIGRYGNQDDARGAIVFARPRFAEWADERLLVTDPQNGKTTLVDLRGVVEATAPIP
jgi:hypothetical protein